MFPQLPWHVFDTHDKRVEHPPKLKCLEAHPCENVRDGQGLTACERGPQQFNTENAHAFPKDGRLGQLESQIGGLLVGKNTGGQAHTNAQELL